MEENEMLKYLNYMSSYIENLELELARQADVLRAEFWEARRPLQIIAKEEEENLAKAEYRKSKVVWCSIYPSSRVLNGSLQFNWSTMNLNWKTKNRIYQSIPLGKKDTYDLRKLLSKCQPFEIELVKDIERRASELRAQWRCLVTIKRMIRQMRQKNLPF